MIFSQIIMLILVILTLNASMEVTTGNNQMSNGGDIENDLTLASAIVGYICNINCLKCEFHQ